MINNFSHLRTSPPFALVRFRLGTEILAIHTAQTPSELDRVTTLFDTIIKDSSKASYEVEYIHFAEQYAVFFRKPHRECDHVFNARDDFDECVKCGFRAAALTFDLQPEVIA